MKGFVNCLFSWTGLSLRFFLFRGGIWSSSDYSAGISSSIRVLFGGMHASTVLVSVGVRFSTLCIGVIGLSSFWVGDGSPISPPRFNDGI